MAFIEMKHCYKRYQVGDTEIVANRDVNFEIEEGELVIILGASGAGKSTVLNLLGGMDTNDEGQIWIDGVNIADYSSHQRTDYRRNDVGFVFQFYNLVSNLTARENVELASEIVKDALDPEQVLTDVGLAHRMDNFPAQLSGGEQQRVSIARAVAKNPKILLCDEPTGALDSANSEKLMALLQEINKSFGITILLVTHDPAAAKYSSRMVLLSDGKIMDDLERNSLSNEQYLQEIYSRTR